MGLGSILGTIGGAIAAPFTGGASLIPTIASAGIGAIGGALGNTQGARTSTSTPTIAPGYQSLAQLLQQRAMQRLNTDTNLSGFQSTGLENIGQSFRNAQTGLNANLTARGLATSPVAAAAQARLGVAQAGQNAQFMNTIPLIQRQFQNEDMANALGQVTQLGRGTSNVGAGSALAGGFSSAAELLAYLQGKGALGQGNASGTMVNGPGY